MKALIALEWVDSIISAEEREKRMPDTECRAGVFQGRPEWPAGGPGWVVTMPVVGASDRCPEWGRGGGISAAGRSIGLAPLGGQAGWG
jgi:hypothetical protein